jgi:hypothetical protein
MGATSYQKRSNLKPFIKASNHFGSRLCATRPMALRLAHALLAYAGTGFFRVAF